MRKPLAITVVVLMIIASIGLAHSNQQPRTRPNIIFILVDDLRWDELSIAGHPFLKTPRIDRIGKERAQLSLVRLNGRLQVLLIGLHSD